MKTVAVFILFLVFPSLAFTQSFYKTDNSIGHFLFTEYKKDSSDTDRVVHPAADPYVFYDPYDPVFEFQSGMFVSTREFGATMSVINRYYNFYGTAFVSHFFNPQDLVADARGMYAGGIMFGKQFQLHTSGTSYDGTLYYARLGPGFGISGAGTDFRDGTAMYAGIHTEGLFGVRKRFPGFGAMYVEIGAKTTWYPAIIEAGLLGAPTFSIGFLFSGSREMVPVRF